MVGPILIDDTSIASIRQDFPILRDHVYLDNAAAGAGYRAVYGAMEEYTREYSLSRMGLRSDLSGWWEKISQTKEQFAHLIGCEKDEVFFVPTTSTGLSIVANMVASKEGSNVVTNDMEFLSNTIVWLGQRQKGVEVRFTKHRGGRLLVEDIEKHLDERTAALSISQVTWWNGFRHDIKTISEIAHNNGAYLVVDGIQCVGAMKVDVKKEGIDFLACGTHKWLIGPGGAAFLYMRKDLAESLSPLFTFIHTLDEKFIERNVFDTFDSYELEYGPPARKHDMVTYNRAAYAGSWAGMDLILNVGIDQVEKRIKGLCEYVIGLLLDEGFKLQTPEDPTERFGIVNVKVKNHREVAQFLKKERKVIVAARLGGIRVSPHFFGTKEDIDIFVKELKSVTNGSGYAI
jgi:cysteine desulfurase / selenocysteine lyase